MEQNKEKEKKASQKHAIKGGSTSIKVLLYMATEPERSIYHSYQKNCQRFRMYLARVNIQVKIPKICNSCH